MTENHKQNIKLAINAQAEDPLLWQAATASEAYLVQSLRWLHFVVEENDPEALAKIIDQSKDNQ